MNDLTIGADGGNFREPPPREGVLMTKPSAAPGSEHTRATKAGAQLHESIANFLRKEISSGRLETGSPLPSESELCQQFGASRGPVRQAMSTLRAEGLISSGRGRRSVVLGTVPSQPFDILYSFTQWCVDSGITPGQRTEYVTRSPADELTAAALDIAPGAATVSVLRLRSMDGAPAMVERLLYPIEFGRHVLDFDPDSGSIYQRLRDKGVDIDHATRVIDAVAADATDARLLGVAEGSPLLRIQRRAFTRAGVPIEFSADHYLPAKASFVLTTVNGAPAPFTMVAGEDEMTTARSPWR